MVKKSWRAALLWFLGGLCILFGATIAGNAEEKLGMTGMGYLLALFVSFALILLGGLMWIAVAIAARRD